MEDESDWTHVYTDGSSSPKTNEGGWAFRARIGLRSAERYGHQYDATNQAMELLAVVSALEFIVPTERPLVIYSDSTYARDCLTKWWPVWERNGWTNSTGHPVKNLELIHKGACYWVTHRQQHRVYWRWVKGHTGNPDNEYVDRLASSARSQRRTNWTGGNH